VSLLLELLHYYENQNTEAPDAVFASGCRPHRAVGAQRPQDKLDERLITQAEGLLAYVITPEHRQWWLTTWAKPAEPRRASIRHASARGKVLASDPDTSFAISSNTSSRPESAPARSLVPVLSLIPADMQLLVIVGIMDCDRIRKPEAEALAKRWQRNWS